MKFEVVETKISRFEEWAVQRFDQWWLERKIRVANHQVRLAEEQVTNSLEAAAQWREYAVRLQDVRRKRGFEDKGKDWKPPFDLLTFSLLMLTLAIAGCTFALAIH